MPKWDFWGKRNTNWFKQNPQNAWRKKSGIAFINEELQNKGKYPATKQDIEVNYLSMISLERDELEKLATDTTKPILINILAKNLLNEKWFDIAEKMLDRGIWKAKQTEEVKQQVEIVSSKEIENKDLTELKNIINNLTK